MGVLGEPVFSSLLAWMLLGESLSAMQMIAGVVIIFGVWIFIRYGKTKPEPIPADAPVGGQGPAEPTAV
jgi:drug/metabolite transporter (DMT)-like permease